MSNISSKSIRVNDDWILSLRLEIDKPCDYGIVDFVSENPLEVFSTIGGSIKGNSIIFTSERNLIIYLSYPFDVNLMECVISYFHNTQPTYESIPIPIERRQLIAEESFSKSNQNTKIDTDMVILSAPNDILVKIMQPKQMWISFGEESEYIVASDFITQVQNQTTMIIPIEIFWEKRYLYVGNEVGIFELINVDQHPLKNIFCKRKISNLLKISDLPQKKDFNLNFVSPIGEIVTLGHNNG